MSDKATFTVELQDQASRGANSAAGGIEKLRQTIQKGTDEIRNMQSALGRLKGAGSAVGDVKKQLTARLNATKASVGNAQAAYLRAGGGLDVMGKKADGAGKKAEGAGAKVGGLGDAADGAGKKGGKGGAAIAKGIAVAVAAIVAAWGVMQRFALTSYDNIRTLKITAEAFTGSAKNADALGTHLAAMSGKTLPQTRAELQGIAQDLSASGLAGNNMVTALRAVATASAVLPNAGAKIKSIAEAAVQTKRLTIGLLDLQGTGLTLGDVAEQIATRLKVDLGTAKQALMQGRVGIDTGLQALDAAVQKRFGALAKKRVNSLSSLGARFSEMLGSLFEKVNFEPVLEMFNNFIGLLDESSSTGQALRSIFSSLFGGMGDSAKGVFPVIRNFIDELLIGALNIGTAYYKVKAALTRAIPKSLRKDIDGVSIAMTAGKVVAITLTGVFIALGVAIAGAFLVAFAPIIAIVGAVSLVIYAVKRFGPAVKEGILKAVNWIRDKVGAAVNFIAALPGKLLALGTEMMEKLAEGIRSAASLVTDAVGDVATGVLDGLAPTIPKGAVGGAMQHARPPGAPGAWLDGKRAKAGVTQGASYQPSAFTAGRDVTASNTTTSTSTNQFVFHGMGADDKQWFERKVLGVLKNAANGAGLNPGEVTA